MKRKYKFIIDMDGTLYKFDKGKSRTFDESIFYSDLKKTILSDFFIKKVGKNSIEAIDNFIKINKKYKGEISIGVENELGINRLDYYISTWGKLNPEEYIKYDSNLFKTLDKMKGNIILLTNAPRIWADKVLNFLNLKDLFGEFIFTGEPDLRKPNPQVFRNIASNLGVSEELVFSIGDQEETDIIPAKSVGMKTILIGFSSESVADFQAPDIKTAIKLLNVEGYL